MGALLSRNDPLAVGRAGGAARGRVGVSSFVYFLLYLSLVTGELRIARGHREDSVHRVGLPARSSASAWMSLTHLFNLLLALDAVAVMRLRSGRISVVSHQRGIGWIVSESERTGQAGDEG